MQQALRDYNQDCLDEEKVLLCVGLGHGRMLGIGDADVFGSEVYASGKLGEDLAKAGEILVSGAFQLGGGDFPGVSYELLPDPPATANSAYHVNYGAV